MSNLPDQDEPRPSFDDVDEEELRQVKKKIGNMYYFFPTIGDFFRLYIFYPQILAQTE